SAASTVTVVDTSSGLPSGATPLAVMVCVPGVAFRGMVASIVATPSASAVAEPSVTGWEKKVKVTVEPGEKTPAEIVMVWPGTTVVSLTNTPNCPGGYCWPCAGVARATSAATAVTRVNARLIMAPSPSLDVQGTATPS